ncbi:choice-of-anchor M domain-containing protein [Schaalia hyovaginalis]|uniref:choice-of-anchor M domain-containing protein n=1 Tax=Schaalia hyovaginalis TaxID=29316 RepID=UPI002A75080A|nr:choice-of-anchor M domain-containing protein [Schaalia hyovaginalis]MDY2668952.1 choice-of-anchor M domain-containing protein [Schaalia hyovaginalis]
MIFTKSRIAAGLLACAVAVSMLAPPAQASERLDIDAGHTDAFYIETASGAPKVLVNNGIQNQKHNPDDVAFVISADTYGRYEPFAPYLDRGNVGYYTASENANYFEPGWSAPSFRENGFSSVRIDFTSVQGPGDVAIMGNRLSSEEPFAKFLIPTERIGEITALGNQLQDSKALEGFGTSGIPNGTYYVESGVSLPVFGHTHAHWFFTAAGEYRLQAKAVGVKSSGETVESAPFTTVFKVKQTSLAEPPVITGNEDDADDNTGSDESEDEPDSDSDDSGTDSDDADSDDADSDSDSDEPSGKPEGGSPSGSGSYSPISTPVTFKSGHMDAFYIGTRGGTPQLFLKEDVSASEPTARVPSSVTMVFVKERYEKTGDFKGSIQETAGYHSNAKSRTMSIYSPGWSIDDYAGNGFSKAEVRFTSVEGPGRIVLTGTQTIQGTLPPVLTNNSPYLTAGAVLPVSGHTHGYWLFSRPGTYTVKAQAVATKADGSGELKSPEETYTFIVEPNPADPSVGSGDSPSPDQPDSDDDEPSLEIRTPGASITPGATVEVLAKGFTPDSRIEAALTALSTPFTRTPLVSDVPVGKDGKATLSLALPASLKPGMYNLSAGPVGEDPTAFSVMNVASSSKPITPVPSTPEDLGPSPKTIGAVDEKVEISHGHLDLFTAIAKNGLLYLVAKDDSKGTPVLRDPADVTLRIGQNSFISFDKQIAPNLPKSGYFLDAGGLKQQEMLFPGWDTNGVRPDFEAVDFEILSMSAPEGAKAYMFNTKTFGGVTPAFTNGKLEIGAGSVIRQAHPAHVHTNWLFSAPGTYTMKVRAKAKALNGSGEALSRVATYTWKVGDDKAPEPEKKPESEKKPSPDSAAPAVEPPSPSVSPAGSTSASPTPSTSGGTARSSSAPSVAKAKCFPKQSGGSGADTLLPRIKDDRTSPGEWVDPQRLAFSISDAGKATVPMDIGAISKGSSVWMISMSQVAGVPWIGVNTQHPSLGEKAQGPTTFALTSFSGPGRLEVFEFGRGLSASVGSIWFSGGDGSASGSTTVAPNTHVHPNWVFTKPGRYELGITMTTRAKDGSELSGSTVLTIDVGSADGISDGHFDLGPSIGPAGSTTVWVDADGKPCTPDANDLAAAGLAHTGVSDLAQIQTAILALAFVGGALVMLRSRRLRRR